MKKIVVVLVALVAMVAALTGCTSDANVASKNLSTAADNFQIPRRVVFYNAITGAYVLTIEGYCSVDPGNSVRMSVTCKTSDGFVKDFLGKSDNVTWFAEQLNPATVSTGHYEVVFKPSTVVPAFNVH